MTDEADLLLAIYASVTSDVAFQHLLALLATRFDCCSAALLYIDPRRPEADIAVAYGTFADPAIRARYERDFVAIDPAPAALGRLPVGEVSSTDLLFSEQQLASYKPFLEGFYHPAGLGGALGGPIARAAGQIGMVAVQRPLTRAPFDADDAEAFRALMPHLAQAIHLRRRFFELEEHSAAAERALDPIALAILTFSRDGALRRANPAARDLLGRDDGLYLDGAGRLRARDGTTDRRLRELFGAAASIAGEGTVLAAPRDRSPLPYVLRFARTSAKVGGSSGPTWTILVSDPDRPTPGAVHLLAAAFGMTSKSARLAAALVDGEDLGRYAARVGISINTAKFHLRSAFAAAGVNRQAELVRVMGAVLRDLA